jgi:UDP-3-O-[3-hydroxymyristoyl] glucosamine N-acyltransferase
MKYFNYTDVAKLLSAADNIIGDKEKINFNKLAHFEKSDAASLIWIKNEQALKKVEAITANTVLCAPVYADALKGQGGIFVIITTENPKALFSKIAAHLFVSPVMPGIHLTAYIHPEAVIDSSSYIGPHVSVGKSKVGKGTVIHANSSIYDGVEIGDGTIIHSGVVIGSDGFGYAKNEDNSIEKFPHIGGVIIGNNVEIGANTCIDRGALGDTIIEDNVKIDNLVHIAHNVHIKHNSFIIANAMIGGSVIIGDNAWIAPSVSILQQLKIGSNATVGVAATVTKSIPDNEVWAGSPATELSEFKQRQTAIKNLLKP